jgi:hypothetical protein
MISLQVPVARRFHRGVPSLGMPGFRGPDLRLSKPPRTKLEHWSCRCYMWITGAAARDRGECGAVERIGSQRAAVRGGLGLPEKPSGQ